MCLHPAIFGPDGHRWLEQRQIQDVNLVENVFRNRRASFFVELGAAEPWLVAEPKPWSIHVFAYENKHFKQLHQ